MIVEQNGMTVDASTGEIIEDAYADLDSIEQQLFLSLGSELDQKLVQTRLLVTIHDKGLYRQGLDDEGRAFSSFSSYLKSIEPRLSTVGAGKFRSLQSWMVRYKIFIQGMGYPEAFLREMGSHSDVLLPACSRHDATCTILEDDDPLEGGGKRLGRERFTELTNLIEGKVTASKSGIPEQGWSVNDTCETVREWMEKPEESKAKLSLSCRWVGDKVRVDKVSWWVDKNYLYEPQGSIPIEHFRLIAKSAQVEGLGEDWR